MRLILAHRGLGPFRFNLDRALDLVALLVVVLVLAQRAKAARALLVRAACLEEEGVEKGLFLLICSFFDVAYLHL